MARRRAQSPEARENQLINLAVDLAEKQIVEGNVSPLVLAHYIRMGSTKERLEREKLKKENEHLQAKIEALQVAKETGARYEEALRAFASYSGQDVVDDD